MIPAHLQPTNGRCTPPLVTPPFQSQHFNFSRPKIIRRQSSLSSVSSFNSDQEEDDRDNPFARQAPWSTEEDAMLETALEEMEAQSHASETPYVGQPPSQLVQAIAKAVIAKYRDEGNVWPHSLKKTRARILAISKRSNQFDDIEATPVAQVVKHDISENGISTPGRILFDTESTPKRPTLRRSKPPSQAMTASPGGDLNFEAAVPIGRKTNHNYQQLSHKLASHDGPAPYRVPLPMHRSTSYSGGSPSPLDCASFSDISPIDSDIQNRTNIILGVPPTPPSSASRQARSQSASVMGGLINCPPSPSKAPTLVKGTLADPFGKQGQSDTQHTFYQQQNYPTPPKSARKQRPTLGQGKLGAISLDSSHFTQFVPTAADATLPDSPCPSLRSNTFSSATSSCASLKSLKEDQSMDVEMNAYSFFDARLPNVRALAGADDDMELDSPFHDVFPIVHAKSVL